MEVRSVVPLFGKYIGRKDFGVRSTSSSIGVMNSTNKELGEELELFATYVSLSDEEYAARDDVCYQIRKIVECIWGSSCEEEEWHSAVQTFWCNENKRRRNDIHESKREGRGAVELQCFGSFATHAVCTFLSDVDLAVWGAVGRTGMESNVDVLSVLKQYLGREKELSQSVLFLKKARVPVIKMKTRYGFGCDITVRDVDSTDERYFACQQVDLYERYVR